ncbi:hypothetical protein DPMN_165055 [Dreissena polymorpha]|uniref:Uncharacterized protein n=1 Tax=Dreissena polymorpha TaxID=45954 RepID=A0A9D4IW77_DREPO|nr:hypothetical protein DPMN_165055 [Dreissena polymorpha]
MEICTEEYVQAVLIYSVVGAQSSLREIHFVDIVPEVVAHIQTRFDEYVRKEDLSNADKFGSSSLRKRKTNEKHNPASELGFHTETTTKLFFLTIVKFLRVSYECLMAHVPLVLAKDPTSCLRDRTAFYIFGNPDPSYLERVTDELKAKGVTLADRSEG